MRPPAVPVLTGVLMGLTGCATPRVSAPQDPLPAAFIHGQRQGSAAWPLTDWYRAFGCQTLNELIAVASRTNLDVEEARARVLQADARARQTGAALLPSVDAVTGGDFYSGHSTQGGGHEFDWSAMLSARYEVDFWGRNRAATRSAHFQTAAARAEQDTVTLTTLAGVAATYFQVLAVRERIRIAELNRDAAAQGVAAIQARFDAGIAGPVELALQKAIYESVEAAIVDLEQTDAESRSALAALLGRFPEDFAVRDAFWDAIQTPTPAPGLPAELLTHRPDIYRAEANLLSARADLSAARAAMFPAISLTAGAGVANPALPAAVLTIPGMGPSWVLGGSLTQSIFDHERLKAQRDEAQAKEQELLLHYRASIIAAFSDVENALAALAHANQAWEAGHDSLLQSERAFAGAKARYEAGGGDYLVLLEAQRALYTARDQFVQFRLTQLLAVISLNKALGGGWQISASTSPPPTMGTARP